MRLHVQSAAPCAPMEAMPRRPRPFGEFSHDIQSILDHGIKDHEVEKLAQLMG